MSLKHTTNYQRNYNWHGAYSGGFLHLGTGAVILTGQTYRTWDDSRIEDFSLEFYADGKVRFAGQYGPYPTTCYANKFLIVKTGDSFETFSFLKTR